MVAIFLKKKNEQYQNQGIKVDGLLQKSSNDCASGYTSKCDLRFM